MSLDVFHVDAFTDHPFAGNPAAVCPLTHWPDDNLLQRIAAEKNLSETAYFVAEGDHFRLRWFTPRFEANFCGHATLASAFVLLTILEPQRDSVHFETRAGRLIVHREENLFSMDFPALPPWKCENPPEELLAGLGLDSSTQQFSIVQIPIVQIKDEYFVVLASEHDVRTARPDLHLLEKLHPAGVAITAPGIDADFVSRYFVPSYGIPEDPVTGSIHSSLAPYWAQRLGKNVLHARQVSARGGELWCEVKGDRVIVKGHAVLTLQGSLLLDL